MKKRRVLKKGKIIYTRKGEFVLKLADKLMKEIKPFCQRVKIAGSIRRHEKNPIDIDIVCIPKDKKKLEKVMTGHDFVFHMSAHADVRSGFDDHFIDHAQNLDWPLVG